MRIVSGSVNMLLLSVRLNRSGKLKFVLLTLLVAVAITAFMAINELSHASSEGLEDAITRDVGATGTYVIDLGSDFGLNRWALESQVKGIVRRYAVEPPAMVAVLQPMNVECPPQDALGEIPVFLPDATWPHVGMRVNGEIPVGTQFCLGGVEIPASAASVPHGLDEAIWGFGLFVAPPYSELAALSSSEASTYRAVLVTDRRADEATEIRADLLEGVKQFAVRHGSDALEMISVHRVDMGESIRVASEGVKLVYAIIAWSVLALSALALLVAELIVVRDRSWFFGLSRAVGAGRLHIVTLVVADVLAVLLVGTSLAIAAALLLEPLIADFALQVFQMDDVRLLRGVVVPRLVGGTLVVLGTAATLPSIRALRQDPVDILEPK